MNDPTAVAAPVSPPTVPAEAREGRVEKWCALITRIAAYAIVAAPFFSAMSLWRSDWVPVSDYAAVVARSHDTLSFHPPLLGNTTALTELTTSTTQIYHPGPIELWLLGIPVHLVAPSPAGALFGSALLMALCSATILWVAYRHGGWRMMAITVVLTTAMGNGILPMNLSLPVQPFLSTFALAALFACGWAVLNGDDWFWPAVVFFASLSIQPEVAYMIPAGVLALAIFAARLVMAYRHRHTRCLTPIGRRRVRRVTFASCIVGLVCWAGPIYDQLFGSKNLSNLASAGTDANSAGFLFSLKSWVTMVAAPGWVVDRVYHYGFSFKRFAIDGSQGPPHWEPAIWQIGLGGVITVLFLAGLWHAICRVDRKRRSLGFLACALVVGNLWASALLENDIFGVYHLYIWQAAAFAVWWFVALVVIDIARALRSRWHVGLHLRAPIAAVALAAGLGLVGLATFDSELGQQYVGDYFGDVRSFSAVGGRLCKDAGPTLVESEATRDSMTQGLVAMLLLQGCTIHLTNLLNVIPGPLHAATGNEHLTLLVSTAPEPPPGFRRIAGGSEAGSTRSLYAHGGTS